MEPALLDIHAHYLPPAYREAAIAAGHSQPDGMAALPEWTADADVELMDRLGIAVSMLSISSPGVHFGDDAAARALARQVNDDGRQARDAHPGRFGVLASLPLPDVAGALDEIAYAYDELRVDGVVLLTNVNGVYLGDATLEPVFDELDRRRARIFLHPTSPVCWEHTSLGRPRPMLEFLFDTTHAVVDLVLSGTIARHPNVEIIVPHAGAALPVIADRIAAFSMILPGLDPATDVIADLARLHYDLAGFPLPRQLDALLALATADRLHYGSDYPFTPAPVVEMLLGPMGEVGEPPGSLVAALAANTRRLLPDAPDGGHSMTTEVILTGTGVPHARAGCAGAGTLVRCGDVALQFDAGRSTVMRLMEAGTAPHDLTAVFLTHVHSDHLVGLPDLVMTRWTHGRIEQHGPLVVVAPEGGATRFVRRMLEPFDEDIALRIEHVGGDPISIDIRPFAVPAEPQVVWTNDDGTVRVLAVAVHHEPVPEAVAYRVETPDGVVVVSGDTRVCEEVESLAGGADILVHEACRTTALSPFIAGTTLETIFSYHADTVPLGAMAARAGVPHVVLTHLIPPLDNPADADAFADDLRTGGYEGIITVGTDLTTVTLG